LSCWSAVACLGLLLAPAWTAAQAPSSNPVEALKKRAAEFYSLLLQNKVHEAESYVTADTLQDFRRLSNTPFLGFNVESIELDAGGKAATVLTQIFVLTPVSPQPIQYPRRSAWRLEEGNWFFVAREPVQPIQGQMPGQMRGTMPPSANLPPAGDLRFLATTADLGILRQGDKREARFSFTNVTDHPVTITSVDGSCPCLRLLTDKKTYAPGETGELVLEFDSQDYLRAYSQTVVVRTDPGNLRTELLVKADIQPRRRAAPAPQDTPPASPTGGGQ
jgi:hypothetical protein